MNYRPNQPNYEVEQPEDVREGIDQDPPWCDNLQPIGVDGCSCVAAASNGMLHKGFKQLADHSVQCRTVMSPVCNQARGCARMCQCLG